MGRIGIEPITNRFSDYTRSSAVFTGALIGEENNEVCSNQTTNKTRAGVDSQEIRKFREAIKLYGGLRAAAKALKVPASYLGALQDGTRNNPGDHNCASSVCVALPTLRKDDTKLEFCYVE